MRGVWMWVPLFVCLESVAHGQRLYWRVIGGTGLTPDFPRYDISAPTDGFNPAFRFQHLPDSRSLIVGGLLEVKLTNRFAFEANILHRPLHVTIIDTIFPAGGPAVTTTNHFLSANTWEFPFMLKWNLPPPIAAGRVLPFLEGGVAFRTSQDVLAALPSQYGITAGVGAAIHLGRLRGRVRPLRIAGFSRRG